MIEVVEPGANKVISIGIFSRNIGKEITSDNYKIKAILNGYLVQLLANKLAFLMFST